MITELKKSGSHSWECQKSDDPREQKLINEGFWLYGKEIDTWGRELIIAEVLGRTEIIFTDLPKVAQVIHKSNRAIIKFYL